MVLKYLKNQVLKHPVKNALLSEKNNTEIIAKRKIKLR